MAVEKWTKLRDSEEAFFDDALFEEYDASLTTVTKTYDELKSRFDLIEKDYNAQLAIKEARELEIETAAVEKEFADAAAKRATDMAAAEAEFTTLETTLIAKKSELDSATGTGGEAAA